MLVQQLSKTAREWGTISEERIAQASHASGVSMASKLHVEVDWRGSRRETVRVKDRAVRAGSEGTAGVRGLILILKHEVPVVSRLLDSHGPGVSRAGGQAQMPPVCKEVEDRGTPEKASCIDVKIKDPLGFAAASDCCGRRAMVKKFWCQEVLRKWLFKKATPPHGRVFTEPGCQNHTAAWYVLYRWCVFGAWACIVISSIFGFGSYEQFNSDKWPIYLTNWDLVFGVSQSLLGASLVTRRWRKQKVSTFDPCSMRLGMAERLYWFLYVITSSIALGVSLIYWCAVYNPEINQVDPLNIMLHVCNSLLMIMDLCVSSTPISLRSFWWAVSVVIFYFIFSIIYYSAGGLDKLGRSYIYAILDWAKPGRTLLICSGGLALVVVLHCAVCYLVRIREKVYIKIATHVRKSMSLDMDGNQPVAETQAEIV